MASYIQVSLWFEYALGLLLFAGVLALFALYVRIQNLPHPQRPTHTAYLMRFSISWSIVIVFSVACYTFGGWLDSSGSGLAHEAVERIARHVLPLVAAAIVAARIVRTALAELHAQLKPA